MNRPPGCPPRIEDSRESRHFRRVRVALVLAALALGGEEPAFALDRIDTDVCVYGGTAAGVASAIQASRMGKSIVLIEPGLHVGGMTSGGLGATDIGNKAAIGGIAREFYQRIARHYAQPSAWHLETAEEYFSKRRGGQTAASSLSGTDASMWTFEPKVAENILFAMLNEARVPVYLGQRLSRVRKSGVRIAAIHCESGRVFRGRQFIDCTYEGDLTAQAGVSYFVGREGNERYGETLNGVRAETPQHQFAVGVDPYVTPGDAGSRRLAFIQAGDGGTPGSEDHRLQAYNFRLCFTTNPVNRAAVEAPKSYRPEDYELLARYLETLVAAGKKPALSQFWHPIWMPNHKTDINNNGGFSTDFIGMNYEYPEAGYPARSRIWHDHEDYTRGFIHFLSTSPRVPENIRAEMQQWGMAKDEFLDTGGWPHQLYVREARRVIGAYVMTEHNCRGTIVAGDAVGLAAYNMDSHNCQRIVQDGVARNEGDVQAPVQPYPISYRSLIPKADECENLLVPVCLSATHIAYGSIRMEPVFMILGQSAATAACIAIDDEVPVQEVEYQTLRTRLLSDRQVLEWNP